MRVIQTQIRQRPGTYSYTGFYPTVDTNMHLQCMFARYRSVFCETSPMVVAPTTIEPTGAHMNESPHIDVLHTPSKSKPLSRNASRTSVYDEWKNFRKKSNT